MHRLTLQLIGIIRSPFEDQANMPIQPVGASDTEGEVLVDQEFQDGLEGLEAFSHIYLIYYFHQTKRTELKVVPYMDTQPKGVFATRSPLRPAHVGISIVRLLAVEGTRLKIRGVDVLDGTPLIDIKPYIPHFDYQDGASSGWMKSPRSDVEARKSDNRFAG